jgi:hypothetical protein
VDYIEGAWERLGDHREWEDWNGIDEEEENKRMFW